MRLLLLWQSERVVPQPDPMELALLTTMTVTDSDLETLASDRAKVVRAYILQTGRVAAELAPQAGLQAGTARSYVYAELGGRAS